MQSDKNITRRSFLKTGAGTAVGAAGPGRPELRRVPELATIGRAGISRKKSTLPHRRRRQFPDAGITHRLDDGARLGDEGKAMAPIA